MIILKECKNGNEEKLLIKIDELITKKNKGLFILLYSRNNKEKIDKYLNDKYQSFEFNVDTNLEKDIKKIFQKFFQDKVTTIYSELSGMGKTSYIHDLRIPNKKIIFFPIKGRIKNLSQIN